MFRNPLLLNTIKKVNAASVPTLVNNWFNLRSSALHIVENYYKALASPSYTEFVYHGPKKPTEGTPLESPHDSCHVLVGNVEDYERVFGDMTAPEYAAYDPIFWLHHCFVDYALDVWWKNNQQISVSDFAESTDQFFPFTVGSEKFKVFNSDPLNPGPFWNITQDLIDALKANEGSHYEGTLAIRPHPVTELMAPRAGLHKFAVTVKRMNISGSFTVDVFDAKTSQLIEHRDVFNRSNPKSCSNCRQNPDIGFVVRAAERPRVSLTIRGKAVDAGNLVDVVQV